MLQLGQGGMDDLDLVDKVRNSLRGIAVVVPSGVDLDGNGDASCGYGQDAGHDGERIHDLLTERSTSERKHSS